MDKQIDAYDDDSRPMPDDERQRVKDEMAELPDFEQEALNKEPEEERLRDAENVELNEDGGEGETAGAAAPDDTLEEKKASTERKADLIGDIMGEFERAAEKKYGGNHPMGDIGYEANGMANPGAECVMNSCMKEMSACEMDGACSTLLACLSEQQGMAAYMEAGTGVEDKAAQAGAEEAMIACTKESAKVGQGRISFASKMLVQCTQQHCKSNTMGPPMTDEQQSG